MCYGLVKEMVILHQSLWLMLNKFTQVFNKPHIYMFLVIKRFIAVRRLF